MYNNWMEKQYFEAFRQYILHNTHTRKHTHKTIIWFCQNKCSVDPVQINLKAYLRENLSFWNTEPQDY